jgi:hypothetical protein
MATLPRLSIVCVASVAVFFETSDARASSKTVEPPPLDRRMEVPVALITEGISQPDPQVLLEARQQAAMIFDAIDVALVWTDQPGTHEGTTPIQLVAVVLSDARTGQFLSGSDLPRSVLGVAPHQTGRVYLFWDRIARRARENDVLPQIVLARVLAHEIGHHLLPLKGHSESGIMRPSLNYAVHERPTFTEAQAESIRKLLSDGQPGD